MNADTLEGRWKQMRGELKSWWGRLSDNDFEKIAGKKDRLVGMLQEKYGYTREAAQQEIDRRLKEYDERMRSASSSRQPAKEGETISSTAQNVGASREEKREEKVEQAKRTAEETAASAAALASQPISAVGEKIGSLAETIRGKAPQEGAVGTAATTVAKTLDAAGSYLQEKNLDHMMGDLSSMIRRYPVPALLIGLGIGYLLARGARR